MKKFLTAAFALCMTVCMSLAALAAEPGEANITAQTTIRELRANPAIQGSGYYTYCNEWSETDTRYLDNTLESYVGGAMADDAAEGLNLVVENYNNGVQVTWQVYSPEQIAQEPVLGKVQLYYYPAKTPNAKFAVVLSGNGGATTSEIGEGASAAYQLHEAGYAAFVLRYRSFLNGSDNAPLKDLGNAVKFVEDHAEQFGVQKENYALVGFSSGGQICGLFGSDRPYGYKAYGVPQPAALLLGYPINDFAEVKPVYHILMDPLDVDWRYYWTNLSYVVNENYTPIFFWNGKNDVFYKRMGYCLQAPPLKRALEKYNVPFEYHEYENAPHVSGTGKGTDAEAWVELAFAFWEAQCK